MSHHIEENYERTVQAGLVTHFLPNTCIEIARPLRPDFAPEHFLFDFDGTLADSFALIVRIAHELTHLVGGVACPVPSQDREDLREELLVERRESTRIACVAGAREVEVGEAQARDRGACAF